MRWFAPDSSYSSPPRSASSSSPLSIPPSSSLLPFGIDAAVIILAARLQTLWWVARDPGHVSDRSLAPGLTFWMGVKPREQGLERGKSRRSGWHRVRAGIQRSGAVWRSRCWISFRAPFPFTPFVLAAGALGVNASTFFVTLIVCRLLRFGLEAALAVVYLVLTSCRGWSRTSLPRYRDRLRPGGRGHPRSSRRSRWSEHPAAQRDVARSGVSSTTRAIGVGHAQRQHLGLRTDRFASAEN